MKKIIILAILSLIITTNASLACSRDSKVLEWLEKNGNLEEGKITTTRYLGSYETIASVTWIIEQGKNKLYQLLQGGCCGLR